MVKYTEETFFLREIPLPALMYFRKICTPVFICIGISYGELH